MRQFFRRHLFPLLLLAILPALWLWPLVVGMLPDFMDTLTLLTPMRMEAARQLREGTLPLWNPRIFSGIPLAANPQPSIWYPPQFFFYLVPTPLGNAWVTLFHYMLAGWGAYFLARRLTRNVAAALFAGFTFQFGSMMVSRIALSMHLYTAPWVPWVLLAVEAALRGEGWRPRRGSAFVGIILTLQFLAGAPQISYYTMLVLPIYWLMRAGMMRGRKGIVDAVVQGCWALLLMILLSGIQLVPTLAFMQEVERSEIAVDRLRDQALNGAMTWRALWGGTGSPVEDTDTINAVGLGVLLLCVAAFVRRRSRGMATALLLVGLISWLLSIGALVPLWSKLLPYYAGFHAPRRALILWSCIAPVLAAIGAMNLTVYLRTKKAPRAAAWMILAICAIPTILFLPRLERRFTTIERVAPLPEYTAAIGNDRFFAIDPTLRYSYDSRRYDYGTSLMPNLASWWGLHDAQGYDPLVPKRYGLLRKIASGQSGIFYPSHGAFLTDPASPLLKYLNVQYMIGRYDLFEPGRVISGAGIDAERISEMVEVVENSPRWPLFRYREGRPFAWIPREVYTMDNAEQALLAAAQAASFDVAFVEEPLILPALPDPPEVSGFHVNGREIELTFSAPLARPALLVVSVSYVEGWKAWTGSGEAAGVIPANGALLGVVMPENTQTVTLVYSPKSFWQGLILSLAGVLLSVAVLVPRRRQ
jgi:hypothetical protein